MIAANRSFIYDAVGNLIELQNDRFPDALIANAVRVFASHDEIAHPYPWTVTPEFLLQEILSLPSSLVMGTVAEAIYKRKQIPRSPFVFVPPVAVQVDDDEVMELLAIYDHLEIGDPNRILIENELSDAGIVRLPLVEYCHPDTHVCTAVERITHYSQEGWISHKKVYRKAVPVFARTDV